MAKPRKTRKAYNIPGHAHELTFSTYHRLKMLRSERICTWFLRALDEARKEHRFHIWAYVIMPEHIHLLIWPLDEEYEMDAILSAIKKGLSRKATNYLRKNDKT